MGINSNKSSISRLTAIGLVSFTALYTTFFGGAVFGFGPMQLLLEEDGAFASLCLDTHDATGGVVAYRSTNGEKVLCETQVEALLRIPLVAAAMPIFAPLVGHLSDVYGALVMTKLTGGTAVAGCLALIIASSRADIDNLFFVGFCLLQLAFVGNVVNILSTGMVFANENTRRQVIAYLSALLDAGSTTYLILQNAHDWTESSLLQVLEWYLGAAIFLFGGAIYFWKRVSWETTTITKAEGEIEEETQSDTEVDALVHDVAHTGIVAEGPPVDDLDDNGCIDASKAGKGDDDHIGNITHISSSPYVLISKRPWLDQLRSRQFALSAIFLVFHQCRNNFALLTARDFLGHLGDDEFDNQYLSIFNGLSCASMVGVPFIDYVLGTHGYHAGFQLVNILGIVHGIIQVSSDNLNVQVVGFIVYSFYRGFTFAVAASFLPTFLASDAVGKGAGVYNVLGGAFFLLNLPLVSATIYVFDGDFFFSNMLYLVGIVPVVYLCWVLGACIQEDNNAAQMEAECSKTNKSGTTVIADEHDIT